VEHIVYCLQLKKTAIVAERSWSLEEKERDWAWRNCHWSWTELKSKS